MAPRTKGQGCLTIEQSAERLPGKFGTPSGVESAGFAHRQLRDVGTIGQEALIQREILGNMTDQSSTNGHGDLRIPGVGDVRWEAEITLGQVSASVDSLKDLGVSTLGEIASIDTTD